MLSIRSVDGGIGLRFAAFWLLKIRLQIRHAWGMASDVGNTMFGPLEWPQTQSLRDSLASDVEVHSGSHLQGRIFLMHCTLPIVMGPFLEIVCWFEQSYTACLTLSECLLPSLSPYQKSASGIQRSGVSTETVQAGTGTQARAHLKGDVSFQESSVVCLSHVLMPICTSLP